MHMAPFNLTLGVLAALPPTLHDALQAALVAVGITMVACGADDAQPVAVDAYLVALPPTLSPISMVAWLSTLDRPIVLLTNLCADAYALRHHLPLLRCIAPSAAAATVVPALLPLLVEATAGVYLPVTR